MKRRRRNPEAVILNTVSEPLEEAVEGMLVRMVNPSPFRRRNQTSNFRRLLIEGSQILDRLSAEDSYIRQDGKECWHKMEVAFDSGVTADQRTALTCLQLKLWEWTADDADVAGDAFVQKFRKTLHSALDH